MSRVFITKYALTGGVQERECELSKDMAIDRATSFPMFFHGEGKEWHRSYDAAVVCAENMRLKKIASLKKQLARLEKLSFGGKS